MIPFLARLLGVPGSTYKNHAYNDLFACCAIATTLLGFALFIRLVEMRHWLAWLVVATLPFGCFGIVASLGYS